MLKLQASPVNIQLKHRWKHEAYDEWCINTFL